MHEFGVIRALLRQVATLTADRPAAQVTEVRLRVGPLSGVEPCQLQAAFALLAPEWNIDASALAIAWTPLTALCEECQLEYEVVDFSFVCPGCGSTNAWPTGGDTLVLESISLESAEVAP